MNACKPPRDESDEWWIVTFTIYLSSKGPNNRIKVQSGKVVWNSDDPAMAMMVKARAVIASKAASFNLEYNAGTGGYYTKMNTLWGYVWVKAVNDISKIKKVITGFIR